VWTTGWMDSRHENNSPSPEMCGVFDIVHFVVYVCKTFTKHGLTLVGIEGAVLENEVMLVFNCYDVESVTPDG